MERDANGPLSGLILRIRGERQTIEDVESLRALQTVDEAHDAAIVAGDGRVDADFGDAAIGDFFLMGGVVSIFRLDFFAISSNSEAMAEELALVDRKRFFKLIAIAARKGHVVFDGLRRLDVAPQDAKLGILLVEFRSEACEAKRTGASCRWPSRGPQPRAIRGRQGLRAFAM